jgi:hypothetical protein
MEFCDWQVWQGQPWGERENLARRNKVGAEERRLKWQLATGCATEIVAPPRESGWFDWAPAAAAVPISGLDLVFIFDDCFSTPFSSCITRGASRAQETLGAQEEDKFKDEVRRQKEELG